MFFGGVVLSFVLGLSYLYIIVSYLKNWHALKFVPNKNNLENIPFISVVVAARDEQPRRGCRAVALSVVESQRQSAAIGSATIIPSSGGMIVVCVRPAQPASTQRVRYPLQVSGPPRSPGSISE
jgi:hypothetical protein